MRQTQCLNLTVLPEAAWRYLDWAAQGNLQGYMRQLMSYVIDRRHYPPVVTYQGVRVGGIGSLGRPPGWPYRTANIHMDRVDDLRYWYLERRDQYENITSAVRAAVWWAWQQGLVFEDGQPVFGAYEEQQHVVPVQGSTDGRP